MTVFKALAILEGRDGIMTNWSLVLGSSQGSIASGIEKKAKEVEPS